MWFTKGTAEKLNFSLSSLIITLAIVSCNFIPQKSDLNHDIHVNSAAEGGYSLAVTTTYSDEEGNVISGIWIIQTNSKGEELFVKRFGKGTLYYIRPLFNGGFSFLAEIDSEHLLDFIYLIEVDSKGETTIKKEIIKQAENRFLIDIKPSIENGYIGLGWIYDDSANSDKTWLIKIDSSGDEEWRSIVRKDKWSDFIETIHVTKDSTYIILGETNPHGTDRFNIWLVCINNQGKELWNKTFGGKKNDWCVDIQQTSESGYIISGNTRSYGAGKSDIWLIKIDSEGQEQWNRTFGGRKDDFCETILQTSDGGYILLGNTKSYGAGKYDIWLIKIDSEGIEQWSRLFGGRKDDFCETILQTSDGGYIILGNTKSFGNGKSDVWLIKLDCDGEELWNSALGSEENMWGEGIIQTSDNGFIIVGEIKLYNDIDVLLIKTDSSGEEQWNSKFAMSLFSEKY